MIKVMLVDDHPLFREGVRARLSMCDEIMLVGEAENGRQLLEKLDDLRPDVVLMDINMPEVNGMD
ncbi:MAG: two-component system nitrate/nitrite response regulator NarL, partial [Cellvibrionaceae bacterium]